MANYAKWSDHADRLYIWDTETGEIQYILSESSWMRHTGIPKEALKWAKAGYLLLDGSPTQDGGPDLALIKELYAPQYRLNENTGKVEQYYINEPDFSPLTNPAYLVPGEIEDVENGRLYDRPLPEGVTYGQRLRPA